MYNGLAGFPKRPDLELQQLVINRNRREITPNVELQVRKAEPNAFEDMARFVGSVRDPNTGERYRLHILWDPHVAMNTALAINGKQWTGANYDTPPPFTHDGRPCMLALTSDVSGASSAVLYMQGNDTGPYTQIFNASGQIQWEALPAPSSSAGGTWLGIGDSPISTLTLSDLHDNTNLPAITLRHGGATGRIAVTATGAVEMSSNGLVSENGNGVAEWVVKLGESDDLRWYRAPAAGGTRDLIARLISTGLQMSSGKSILFGSASLTDSGSFTTLNTFGHSALISNNAVNILIGDGTTGDVTLGAKLKVTGNAGFNNVTPIAKPTVTGSRGGNAALASVLTALANYGLITDSST